MDLTGDGPNAPPPPRVLDCSRGLGSPSRRVGDLPARLARGHHLSSAPRAPRACTRAGRQESVAFDTTGDGVIDAFDTNGDGQIDMRLVREPAVRHDAPVSTGPAPPTEQHVQFDEAGSLGVQFSEKGWYVEGVVQGSQADRCEALRGIGIR